MTCKKCKGEFCWVCMGAWKEHTDFYSCNRFDAGKKDVGKGDKKQASRAALERYLFYYHRYINHHNSRKLESATLAKARGGRGGCGGVTHV